MPQQYPFDRSYLLKMFNANSKREIQHGYVANQSQPEKPRIVFEPSLTPLND